LSGGLPGRSAAPGLVGRARESGLLDGLLQQAGGQSRVLVLRGEPGIGKTALIEHAIASASGFQVARATGVESEMELPFAGLHQLCAPMLDRLALVPGPQREALSTAFGVVAGPPPDRFLIGLASLSLLTEAAENAPLLCVVDDAQWLDRASAQAMAFIARRLLADRVCLLFGTRDPLEELKGLPELVVEGLSNAAAGELLAAVVRGPLDNRVFERIVAETHGNPLALLEWPRWVSAAALGGGFGLPTVVPMSGQIEESFRRRLVDLPPPTRRFLTLAAAEPTGDAALIWRAADRVGVVGQDVAPAIEAGLVEMGSRVRFRHPSVRSAAYAAATIGQRQDAHAALADATDPAADPDRRAWHRALATAGQNDEVAEELERSAGRAQGRGGVAAAAAFLERSAALTLDPQRRTQRTIAAASAHLEAGAFEAVSALMAAVEAGPLDELHRAQVEILRAQVASEGGHPGDAAGLFLSAARRLEPIDLRLARSAYLSALQAADGVGDLAGGATALDVARAARLAPVVPGPRRLQDLLLDGQAVAHTDGPAAAAPIWREALGAVSTERLSPRGVWLLGHLQVAAALLWDYGAHYSFSSRFLEAARELGALRMLPWALDGFALVHVWAGDLDTASVLAGEMQSVIDAIGVGNAPWSVVALAAWRGHEEAATSTIAAAIEQARHGGQSGTTQMYRSSEATLCNGLGRYEDALIAAERAHSSRPHLSTNIALAEQVEAGVRAGRPDVAAEAMEQLSQSTQASGTDWALGVEARCRALLTTGDSAEALYIEAIQRLDRSPARPDAARSHLVFGEWLRRQNRRVDARHELHNAHEALSGMGMDAFADRARRELHATGETVRKRNIDTRGELTAQEAQVAALAHDGLSNPEIGARLFISSHTVQYHLSKVFAKLGISSRIQLGQVLPGISARVDRPD
jgi:DNA-binding CsgD family transcriptional regulator